MNSSHYWQILQQYFPKGVIVDTNLLLLYVIGKYNVQRISNFKRTKEYTIEDYEILIRILHKFKKIVTTPNILTEVSNLCGHCNDSEKSSILGKLKEQICILDEQHISSDKICQNNCFVRYGLTDTAIAELAKNSYLVLTSDLPLTLLLQQFKIDVINFNNIRTLSLYY